MQTRRNLPFILERNLFNLLLIVLLGILYGPVIIHWYDGWINKNINIEHEYFSHGMIGFIYAAYLVWIKRKKWQRLENRSHPLGVVLLFLGAFCYLAGTPQLVSLSFPIVLTGICLWLKGIPGLKLHSFTLVLIFLATPNPIPYLITPYTLPLQAFIASVAGFILMQLGFNVSVDQIYLAVNGRQVEVAPYCAGLKMLFTSLYVALILLHWTDNLGNRKRTIILLVSTLIISTSANIIRNTLLAFFHGTGQVSMFEWLHEGWGGDLYSAVMLGTIILLLKAIERFDVKVEPETTVKDYQINQ